MYSFPNLEPVHCSMSGSNCCLLTCIQISQEAGEAIWYSHLFKNFPLFVVIHIVKGFSVVKEADVFLEFSCFFLWSNDCWQFDLLFLWEAIWEEPVIKLRTWKLRMSLFICVSIEVYLCLIGEKKSLFIYTYLGLILNLEILFFFLLIRPTACLSNIVSCLLQSVIKLKEGLSILCVRAKSL